MAGKLTEIMEYFRRADGPVDLTTVSRCLDIEPGALEGMLQLLVRKGRLREITPGSEACARCSRRSGCSYGQTGDTAGKIYEPADTR